MNFSVITIVSMHQ